MERASFSGPQHKAWCIKVLDMCQVSELFQIENKIQIKRSKALPLVMLLISCNRDLAL